MVESIVVVEAIIACVIRRVDIDKLDLIGKSVL